MQTSDARRRGEPLGLYPGRPTPRLYDEIVRIMRVMRRARRTEESYLGWIRRFIEFHGGRHPMELDAEDVNAFLSDLAVRGNVAASTQNQALSAILFLYKHVLDRPLGKVDGIVRAKRPKRVPVALTRTEVAALFEHMTGLPKLIAMVLYGGGLRVNEALDLRVKDLEFERGEIYVREPKGGDGRVTMLPRSLIEPLKEHLRQVRAQHQDDLSRGLGGVALPYALARKYPNAEQEWIWQRVFPATSFYLDRQTGAKRRHHLHETVVQKAVRAAALAAGITKHVTPHVLRHTFATHLVEDGYTIVEVQKLMGHKDIRTTRIYLHVLDRGGLGIQSPLDRMNRKLDHRSYADREGFITRDPDGDNRA